MCSALRMPRGMASIASSQHPAVPVHIRPAIYVCVNNCVVLYASEQLGSVLHVKHVQLFTHQTSARGAALAHLGLTQFQRPFRQLQGLVTLRPAPLQPAHIHDCTSLCEKSAMH